MSYLLFHIIPLCNVKRNMLLRDYAIRHMPSKKAKVLKTFVLELLVIRDRPAQRERPGTQRAVEQDTFGIGAYEHHFNGQRNKGKLVQRLGCVFSWQLSVMCMVTLRSNTIVFSTYL